MQGVESLYLHANSARQAVTIEALKDSLRQKKATVNEIHRYAKVCRVSNVIRPYMGTL